MSQQKADTTLSAAERRDAAACADRILAHLNPPPKPGQFSFDRYIDDVAAGVTDRPGIVRAGADEAERLNRLAWDAMNDAGRHMAQVSRACAHMAETANLCGFPGARDAWTQTAQDADRLPAAIHHVLNEVLRRSTDTYAIVEEVGRDRFVEALDIAGVARGMLTLHAARSGSQGVVGERLSHHAGYAHRALASLIERHAAIMRYRAAIGMIASIE